MQFFSMKKGKQKRAFQNCSVYKVELKLLSRKSQNTTSKKYAA